MDNNLVVESSTEHVDIYRKLITRVIAVTVMESKICTNISASCLDLLVDLLQSMLITIGSTARAYAEHNGRVESNLQDILLTFNRMHIRQTNLGIYAQRPSRMLNCLPSKLPIVRPPVLLRVMPYQPHKSHIPKYLPPLPDSHTYRFTKAQQKVDPDYGHLREKSSTQKLQLSHALSRFLAKVTESINLLGDDSPDMTFKVMKPVPTWPSYLNGLVPNDQHFDFEELEYFHASAQQHVCLYETEESEINNPFLKAAKLPRSYEFMSEEVEESRSTVEHFMKSK